MAVIGSDNLVFKRGATAGVTLAAGTYTAGSLLVEGATNWSLTAIDGTARIGVLLEDVDTAVDGTESVVALEGDFNLNKITFGADPASETAQTFDDVKVHLDKAGINLTAATKE